MSTVTDFLTDPTVHNALLSSMAVTSLINAMPTAETLKATNWKELPIVVYKYVYDALHTFMSLKSGAPQIPQTPQIPQLAQLPQLPPPHPTDPAQMAPETQPAPTTKQ